MDRRQLLSLGVAALCMAAIGVSATTLDGTVSTKPDDVIDLNFDSLPIGQDSAKDIDEEINANKQRDGSSTASKSDPASDSSETSSTSQTQQSGQGLGGGSGPTEPASESQGTGTQPRGELSLLQKLLALLQALLPYVLGALAVALVVSLSYRYRHRLAALALLPFASSDSDDGPETPSTHPWEDVQVGDDVQQAWYTMVQATDIERPWAKTPDECRRQAIEAGLDPSAVETLTETFREARYAERGPSGDHERRARESLEQIGLRRRSA